MTDDKIAPRALLEKGSDTTFLHEMIGFATAQHRTDIYSTNPIERLNGEIKRGSEVVGIFPNEAAVTRLIGALLLEQNDEWAVQRARYMSLETIAPLSIDIAVSLPPLAARPSSRPCSALPLLHHGSGHDPDNRPGLPKRVPSGETSYRTQGAFGGSMRQTIIVMLLAAGCLSACADSGARNPGGAANAQQNFQGVTINNGSNNNYAYAGSAAPSVTGAANNSVPVNLALDPSSFSSIFGAAKAITNPAKEDVQQAQQQAQGTGDAVTAGKAAQCLLNLSKCTVTVKPGS